MARKKLWGRAVFAVVTASLDMDQAVAMAKKELDGLIKTVDFLNRTFGNVKLQGEKKVRSNLDRLLWKNSRKALTKAVKAGAQVLKAEVVRNAPEATGYLKKHLSVVNMGSDARNTVAYGVGPSRKAFYGLFLEKGAKAHPIKLSGLGKKALAGEGKIFGVEVKMHPGVRARNFIRGALDAAEDAIASAVKDTYWIELRRMLA